MIQEAQVADVEHMERTIATPPTPPPVPNLPSQQPLMAEPNCPAAFWVITVLSVIYWDKPEQM